jgi:N-acyl-D-aspartate/D-glutamate deacylase
VRRITGELSALYGLRGRGVIVPGSFADLVVFDPATIGPGPARWRQDLPGGAGRLFADALGIDHVIVNGVVAVSAGSLTGARPGRVLRSGKDTDTVLPA